MTTHSLFYFAAGGGEYLMRQARRVSFPVLSGAGKTDYRVF
jgi:hypothetical protein